MEYNFSQIEKKWQKFWKENNTYKVDIDNSKPKYYVLDMFPYPSGAGLHVGHPLGYIASDIYSRYKKLKGFNVLHPMGFDAFGLPAEQYAIKTGQHPAITTDQNIIRYKEQLENIGFSFDWSREVKTSDPKYYKWTQWVFTQLFASWYNKNTDKAEPIDELIAIFEQGGNAAVNASTSFDEIFDAAQWKSFDEQRRSDILMNYRLAYLSYTAVNWCPELGTVLANDEVKDGLSVRGGHPVERKSMRQWSLRITAYAHRLLDDMENLDWTDSLKEMQRNWIGKSTGAQAFFQIKNSDKKLEIFTTRPDTLFGSTFMVIAPEHEWVAELTTDQQKSMVNDYLNWAKSRSERERMTEVKKVSGVFTGSFAINPFTGTEIPIYIADYVLTGYGTGAIMAVPAHDSRDYAFAKHFNLPIIQVVSGGDISEESYDTKEGKMMNSGFLDGLEVKAAIVRATEELEKQGIGAGKINFRLRDAIFSRQRYWGEPFPIFYKNDIPHTLDLRELPLELPEVDKFLPTEKGEPPLARAKNWQNAEGHRFEYDTMPGFAGSSGYYLRYMDPRNDDRYFSAEAVNYWQDVDLYIGGAEHATGHLIYSRFWNKFLFDLGMVVKNEPFKKLINQGMIQGRSNFVYRRNNEKFAEHLLWEELKGKNFVKDYHDGHRKFDFYNHELGLAIEIKSKKNIEKLEQIYASKHLFAHRLLLISQGSIINHKSSALAEIDGAMSNTSSFENGVRMVEIDKDETLNPIFYSKNVEGREEFCSKLHVDINIVHNDVLDLEAFKNWQPEFAEAEFVLEDGKYICGWEVEKMSKSLYNVQNPDDLVEKYGADTLRLYEMFLGPLEQSKPWDTNGIEGVFRFIKKYWRLFVNEGGKFEVSEAKATEAELKVLHRTIKKIGDDIERFSFNTGVSTFMICVNDLADLKCNKREVLESLNVLLSPYAPHIAEEIWNKLGHQNSVTTAIFPSYDEQYLVENSFEYPVSFNGKMRFKITYPLSMTAKEIEEAVLEAKESKKWTDGTQVKKIIVVHGRIINVVLG